MPDTPGMVVIVATVGMVVVAATVGMAVMIVTVATVGMVAMVGMAGMVEAHLTGHGVRADVCGLCPLSTSSAGSASPLLLTLLLKSSPPAEIDETIGPRSGQKRSRVSLKTRQSPMHARYSDQAPDFFPAKTAPPPLFSPAMLPFPHALSVQHV
jgi:hypothetical protein